MERKQIVFTSVGVVEMLKRPMPEMKSDSVFKMGVLFDWNE